MAHDKYAGRAPRPDALADAAVAAEGCDLDDGAAALREARWRAHGGPAAAEAELGHPVASFAEYMRERAARKAPHTGPTA